MSGDPEIALPQGPELLDEIQSGAWRAVLLDLAVELDVASALYDGDKNLDDLAQRLNCAPAGLAALLDALCGQRLLAKTDSRYGLPDTARFYLARQSPACTAEFYRSPYSRLAATGDIAQIIRHGRRSSALAEPSDARSGLITWRQSMASSLKGIWTRLGLNEFVTGGEHRLLDLGCGSGIRTLMLLTRLKNLRIEAVDRAGVVEVAREIAGRLGVADRVDFIPAEIEDFVAAPEVYDTIFLGSVMNYFDPAGADRLLGRLFHSLRTGGRLILFGPLADDERCTETLALLLNFQLYVTTPNGRVYTAAEVFDHLAAAGFRRKRLLPPMLIEARK